MSVNIRLVHCDFYTDRDKNTLKTPLYGGQINDIHGLLKFNLLPKNYKKAFHN